MLDKVMKLFISSKMKNYLYFNFLFFPVITQHWLLSASSDIYSFFLPIMLPARERKEHLCRLLEADERQRWRMHRQIAGISFLLKRLTWPLWCRLCWPACPPYSPSLRRRPDWSLWTPPGENKEKRKRHVQQQYVEIQKSVIIWTKSLPGIHKKKEKDLWLAVDFVLKFIFVIVAQQWMSQVTKRRKNGLFTVFGTVRGLWKDAAWIPNGSIKLPQKC